MRLREGQTNGIMSQTRHFNHNNSLIGLLSFELYYRYCVMIQKPSGAILKLCATALFSVGLVFEFDIKSGEESTGIIDF